MRTTRHGRKSSGFYQLRLIQIIVYIHWCRLYTSGFQLVTIFPILTGYDELPDAAKYATTIGRYHTIVPPINRLSSGRPVSRSYSVMAETPLPQLAGSEEYGPADEHAINTVSEENHPGVYIDLSWR